MHFKKKMISGAVAFAVISVSTSVGAGIVSPDITIQKSNNLYYTGLTPSTKIGLPEDPADDATTATDYLTTMMAVSGYPTNVIPAGELDDQGGTLTTDAAKRAAANCPEPDADRTCYGEPAAVVDLTNYSAGIFVKASGTVDTTSSYDANGNLLAGGVSGTASINGLTLNSVIGLWVLADSGSTGTAAPIYSYDGLAGLQNYKDTFPNSTDLDLDTNDDGFEDRTLDTVRFRTHNPGFTPVGAEFMVFDSGTESSADVWEKDLTADKPATATHLLLAYNVDNRGGFSANAANGELILNVSDNAAFQTLEVPANVGIAATLAGAAITPTTSGYTIFKGEELVFAATVTPDTANGGGTIPGGAPYTWSVDGTDDAETSAAFTEQFNVVGTFEVAVAITDSLGTTATESVNVAVASTAPTANFTSVKDTGLAVNFTDSSTALQSKTISSWAWDFGVDGVTTDISTDQNPNFTFPAAGDYTVNLTVTDSGSEESEVVTKTVTVVDDVATTSGGGGGGVLSLLFGLGLLLPAFVRRRLK